MKKSIIIGVILIVIGAAYIWWWNQPIKQMADLAMQGQVPQNWSELGTLYPQLSRAFHLLEIDPFDQTVGDPSQKAQVISRRLYVAAGRNGLAGVGIILAGIALPVGTAIRNRKRKKSEQGAEGDG